MIQTYENAEALNRAAAELFVAEAARPAAHHRRFAVVLAGGQTPRSTYELLARPPLCNEVDWSCVHVFWGDERCVPPDDARSNFGMTRDALLDHVSLPKEQIHRVRGELSPDVAASDYQSNLEQFFGEDAPRFDLVFLGLGGDGHTASLFPRSIALSEKSRWTVGIQAAPDGLGRVSLTIPILNEAKVIAFIVSGSTKSNVLTKVLSDSHKTERLPAQLIQPRNGKLYWMVDSPAAAGLRAKEYRIDSALPSNQERMPMQNEDNIATQHRDPVSPSPRVLTVDIGGNHVKVLASGASEHRRFDSGPTMTPDQMVAGVLIASADWQFDVVSLGYPGPVANNRPMAEPHNLAPGWVGFDYETAFGRPVRMINDAAMQALGSYEGGRMLFLGLGTGLGSAMVINGELAPMELAHLPYRKRRTYEDYVGERGFKRLGPIKWRKHITVVIELFRAAFQADDIVLGGGNVHKIDILPPNVRRGDNENAFLGGFRLWEDTGSRKKKI